LSTLQIENIAEQDESGRRALLDLNNAHARETSFMTEPHFESLLAGAFSAVCVPKAAALLIAFDHSGPYDNPNFRWFSERYQEFAYVDRIVVGRAFQGMGLARRLYEHLFDLARQARLRRVVCEVNLDPPNPESDAFHERMGFAEVGKAVLKDREKTVRYLCKPL
jgi:predicted GNAT superfamily acetyltransferase